MGYTFKVQTYDEPKSKAENSEVKPKAKKSKRKVTRRFRKVPKDKKTGVAKKYLSGAKNKAAKAAEIKRTAAAYKRGEYIDIKAVQKSRVAQDGSKKKKRRKKKA